MKLDDLKAMNIPNLAPIQIIEHTTNRAYRKNLGYLKGIEFKRFREGGEYPVLAYYSSPNDIHSADGGYNSSDVNDICSVTILVPKEESVS